MTHVIQQLSDPLVYRSNNYLPTNDKITVVIIVMNTYKAHGIDSSGYSDTGDFIYHISHSTDERRNPHKCVRKGHKNICDNYCEISYLSVVRKMFTSILLHRLLYHVSPDTISESQCEFSPNLHTTDKIFTARQLQEFNNREQHDFIEQHGFREQLWFVSVFRRSYKGI